MYPAKEEDGGGIGVVSFVSSPSFVVVGSESFAVGCGGGGVGREVTATPVRVWRSGGMIEEEWWAVDRIRRRRGFDMGDDCCVSSVSVSAEGGEAMVGGMLDEEV